MIRQSIIRTAAAILIIVTSASAARRPRRPPVVDPVTTFFAHSDLQSVRTAAQSSKASASTVFAAMESAALQLDNIAVLDYALRICERWGNDPRAAIASSRILELAANTPAFRASAPRLRALLNNDSPQANTLRAALIAAADDGVPGIDRATLARDSGLLTDWRVAGPFGRFGNVAFERSWPPERDSLAAAAYDVQPVEELRFDNGTFRLPDYFSPEGVLYAASRLTLTAAETRVLRVESPGTLEVQVDGHAVLTKDDRLDATPETVSAPLHLSAGPHDVVVKFITSAVPFRIALVPEPRTKRDRVVFSSDVESAYVAASEKFWAGDYDGALAGFTTLRREHDSAAVEYMLARGHAVLDNTADQAAALSGTVKLAPSADAAAHDRAMIDIEQNRAPDALARARKVALAHPRVADAQELFATAAMQAGAREDAKRAITNEIELHPSCAILSQAVQYLSANGDSQMADAVTRKLDHCAPESIAYAKQLADAGDHVAAARAATMVAREYPLDRQSRALAIKELMLAGDLDSAKQTAEELVRIAPNSGTFASLLQQASNPAADPFASGQEFFRPFRRDGVMVVRRTSERRYSGGPSVTLLHDRVVRLDGDGGATIYVHKITRVLNRDGIEQEGEVTLPLGAEALELRTIKPDLTTAEPEFNAHKSSVSMPALAAGDAIDAEYVYRVTDLNARPEVMEFDFGSFTAPIVYARFIVISSAGQALRVWSKGAPEVETRRSGNTVTQIWESSDIVQTPREIASAPDSLPYVRLSQYANWSEVRDLYRDALIDAVRSGPQIEQAAAAIKPGTQEQMAEQIYRDIKGRIHSADTAFSSASVPTAESTLARLSGSRTIAAIAIARAAGLRADLLLARNIARAPALPSTNIFTRPLVQFTLADGHKLALDFETDGIAFGALPPVISNDALYVPLANEQTQPIAAIPQSSVGEESVATGDVTLNSGGDLTAHVLIRMGSWRGMQMRGVLAGIEPSGRAHFFEQLAARIFPGAGNTRGLVRHEHDSDQPLEIEFTTESPAFVNTVGHTVDLDQLVPALGLRKMYGVDARRSLPLYVDTPLIERSSFRIHLPGDLAVSSNANDLSVDSEFGDYAVTFRTIAPGVLEVTRTFRLPVQVITPNHFGTFADFARKIDDAERQRITLVHVPVAAANNQ